jgi:hypothetical protein
MGMVKPPDACAKRVKSIVNLFQKMLLTKLKDNASYTINLFSIKIITNILFSSSKIVHVLNLVFYFSLHICMFNIGNV